MSDELVFMMGEYPAPIRTDRQYARNHMWAMPHGEGHRFGFTPYAVRLLQDVYFLDWSLDAPSSVREKQEIGAIESSKAESSLYAPSAGQITEFNPALLSDPSQINLDNYGTGWLFHLAGAGENLLSPAQYIEHLEQAWIVAQRTIKGQMNE